MQEITKETLSKLNYDPTKLKRELTPFYISASSEETSQMLSELNIENFEQLYSHINKETLFSDFKVGPHLDYNQLVQRMIDISNKNKVLPSFLGDSVKDYSVSDIVPFVCNIRGLTTAYTPYQPERSQGTLISLWLYSSCVSMLTGFEAINSSFYDRSTALFESLNTALRLNRNKNTVIISDGIHPNDKEVLLTQSTFTNLKLIFCPVNQTTGLTDINELKKLVSEHKQNLAGMAFSQMNKLGRLEDVNILTDIADENSISSIAIVDPILLAKGGLLKPSEFGSNNQGTTMIVGEAQHLAIGPNFGGPGLGLFGIRFNEKNKNQIRSTAGRFVGKAKDANGNLAYAMVLSTREQHIRRDKANSNICSNQSFLATIAGASILSRGDEGLERIIEYSKNSTLKFLKLIDGLEGIELKFKDENFFNEVLIEVNTSASKLIELASRDGLNLGINVSDRLDSNDNLILMSFTDKQSSEEFNKLSNFLKKHFNQKDPTGTNFEINESLLATKSSGLKRFSMDELKEFYTSLGEQNISPDDIIYPLGSCTMKYNPYVNDFAASLPGFTESHPSAPAENIQGSLEVLYEIQEQFKNITGLPGVTTQPVAGAQGELVGLKLFQAYHTDIGEAEQRDIMLIPASAHGTNPATASVAGFVSKKHPDGRPSGIVTISANENAQINLQELKEILEKWGKHVSGIMVTNPNTSGIFESEFKEMAEMVHEAGGLVYMDGANMNAIAGWVDLDKLGVDAVHNNLHKTWTIPHGGGGPGDAIVAVSDKLIDFLPGHQILKNSDGSFIAEKAKKSIGSIHRDFGNFAHKVRCLTYLYALGTKGIKEMSAMSVLSAKYLYEKLKKAYPTLPLNCEDVPRMHEFILTLEKEDFEILASNNTPKAQAIAKVGKLFLDYGLHAPTVAFPEIYGLMIEPTESYTKAELDRFIDVVLDIKKLLKEYPKTLMTTPHFTPVTKVDEVWANKNLSFFDHIKELPEVRKNLVEPSTLANFTIEEIREEIISAHKKQINLN